MGNETTKESGGSFRDRAPNVVALDNLIRRTLRVSDPTDAAEVANALSDYYASDREVMKREAAGLPFVTGPALPTQQQTVKTATSAELDQAVSDVERDLSSLIESSLLKDIVPELGGWATVIRSAIAEGVAAARLALDPRLRDKAFAARRIMGDYARMARFVGALTPTMNLPYRRLAQSLDEVASVLLVLMGESIANVGFSGGKFLLQAPLSELQERRDAALYALRNLVGSTQEAYGSDQWPRGLYAYQQFLERLTKSAQYDIRPLFQENELARIMDDLIHLAAGGNVEGLRALGSTAQITLDRFRRVILLGQNLIDPESPALATFLTALKLFLDAFDDADRGYRLLNIARPPILFYGLYGVSGPDDACERLLRLIIRRGELAEALDCYMGCFCSETLATGQIILDKVLYDLDRCIDFYALGSSDEDFGEPEQRAAACGFTIMAILRAFDHVKKTHLFDPMGILPPAGTITGILEAVQAELWKPDYVCGDTHLSFNDAVKFSTIHNIPLNYAAYVAQELGSSPPRDVPEFLQTMETELCLQRQAEEGWKTLLLSMTPSCIRFGGGDEFGPIERLLCRAVTMIDPDAACPEFDIDIPPDIATSLAGITYLRWSQGGKKHGGKP